MWVFPGELIPSRHHRVPFCHSCVHSHSFGRAVLALIELHWVPRQWYNSIGAAQTSAWKLHTWMWPGLSQSSIHIYPAVEGLAWCHTWGLELHVGCAFLLVTFSINQLSLIPLSHDVVQSLIATCRTVPCIPGLLFYAWLHRAACPSAQTEMSSCKLSLDSHSDLGTGSIWVKQIALFVFQRRERLVTSSVKGTMKMPIKW